MPKILNMSLTYRRLLSCSSLRPLSLDRISIEVTWIAAIANKVSF